MKVSELIAKLSEFDPDALVILSIDPEGNGFSQLAEDGIGTGYYDHEDREVVHTENDWKYLEREGPFEPNCVTLWP